MFRNSVDLPSTNCALADQPFQTIATVLLVGSIVLAAAGLTGPVPNRPRSTTIPTQTLKPRARS